MAKRDVRALWDNNGSDAAARSKRARGEQPWSDFIDPLLPISPGFEDVDDGQYVQDALNDGDHAEEANTVVSVRSVSSLSDEREPTLVSLPGSDATQEQQNIVCMGMIPQIHCQRLVKGYVNVDITIVPEQNYIHFQHRSSKGRLLLGIEHAPRLMQVNAKAATVLNDLCALDKVSLIFQVSRSVFIKFLEETAKDSGVGRPKRLPVDVNIYGPQSICPEVGTMLSDQAMFLQDPVWRSDSVAYDNPHLLKLGGTDDVEVWFQSLLLDTATQTAPRTDWNTALDGLSTEQTDAPAVDDREPRQVLRTELMPHQVTARNFMSSRESGQLSNHHRFWQLDRSEGGSSVYRHIITAEESAHPQQEPLGGILADDMGLGKTLTSIALIATSLDRAQQFAGVDQSRSHNPQQPAFAKGTLVIVPSTLLMDGWVKELEKHVAHDTLKIAIYHGHSRVQSFKELQQYDVVLTTYGTVATEYRRTKRQVLYYLKWFRIILDEAHWIRTRTTQQFKAVMLLDAQHCWCLTGTPIQNRIEDLGSLLEFCRVPLLQESKTFHQFLTKVHRESPRRGVQVVRNTLSVLCLRRTKRVLDLAPAKLVEHRVRFSASERQRYNEYFRRRRNAMNDVVSGKTQKGKHLSQLELLLRLRIFCNQGTINCPDEEEDDAELDADEVFTLLEEREAAFCAVCFSNIKLVNQFQDNESGVLGDCFDVLCRACYIEAQGHDAPDNTYRCPVCEKIAKPQALSADVSSAGPAQVTTHSSKLDRLIQDLLQTKDHEKSIVFSQWRKTLSIASNLCKTHSIPHVSIDGTTLQAERIKTLERFADDPAIPVILMTLGTGAQGLNIIAASRVHILEPQWNPAVEAQAIGRVVRIGQRESATVVRYIVDDSVDVYIQAKQRQKTELASGGFSET